MFNTKDLLNPNKIHNFNKKVKEMSLNQKSLKFKRATTEPVKSQKLPKRLNKVDKKSLKIERKQEKQRKYASRVPKKYHIYIQSPFWETRRQRYFRKYGRKCAVCGSRSYIHLHHKLYGEFGIEKDENLVALCGFHHEQIHEAIGKTKKDMVDETNKFVSEMKTYYKNKLDKEIALLDQALESLKWN